MSVLDDYDQGAVSEFLTFLNDATGAFGYATTGINILRDRVLDVQAQFPLDSRNRTFLGSGPPTPDNRAYQAWRSLDVPGHLDSDGPVLRQIGNQWVISVFHEWDEYFRGRIATATGIADKGDLVVPELGDLRLIRNDIIHNRGVASRQAVDRCETLRWFTASEDMVVSTTMVDDFVDRFGLTHSI